MGKPSLRKMTDMKYNNSSFHIFYNRDKEIYTQTKEKINTY